jgi:hypothetical protein
MKFVIYFLGQNPNKLKGRSLVMDMIDVCTCHVPRPRWHKTHNGFWRLLTFTCRCFLVMCLNRTPIFDCHMVRWGLKNKHHKVTCVNRNLKEIERYLQSFLITPHSITNTFGEYLYIQVRSQQHGEVTPSSSWKLGVNKVCYPYNICHR